MLDFQLWAITITCGLIGLPMLVVALIKECAGRRHYTPRAKYARG